MSSAAVLTAVNDPLEYRDDVTVDDPKPGEIKVRIAATGVCHSDLSMQNGTMLANVPMILGHEASAIVEEVGDGVTNVAPGDHIVVSFVAACGDCFFCQHDQGYLCQGADMGLVAGLLPDGTARSHSGGADLNQMCGCGTFAETTVIAAINAVKIDKEVDLRVAALIGCGVLTGVGAALNTARIAPGDTVAVVGCGGVGLNVIQGARIAGASEIVAIDLNTNKLEMTKRFGATTTIDAGDGDPIAKVKNMTGGRGADVAFEVIGNQVTIDQTIQMTRRGGQAILVGVPPHDATLNTPAFLGLVFQGKTIAGSWYGSSNVQRDVPRLLDLYKKGDLFLEELISREIKLPDVNEAFAAMKTGEVARSVVVF
ncbi:MAG TPA: Zn-dependent alcohol dehydrogenase [Actinomycetota bacterium]|nr:Zn-dependent alcohol dehydrogenase [Actinomycetota bacterium]